MVKTNILQANALKKLLLSWLMALVLVQPVFSQSASPNYSIEESFVGPGGLIDATSPNYQARVSLGDTGIGNSASANFQIYGGYTTTDEEFLEFVVTGATVDLGVLSESTTGTGTGTFYVRTYIAQGYTVAQTSQPPTLAGGGSTTLQPMAAQGASSVGTEQFGINLVANTSPTSFGANPVQVPDSSFSFGYANANYDDTNQYRYGVGDIVAQSDSSSGRTTYTISYIANMAFLTEAGVYTMQHDLVATSTF